MVVTCPAAGLRNAGNLQLKKDISTLMVMSMVPSTTVREGKSALLVLTRTLTSTLPTTAMRSMPTCSQTVDGCATIFAVGIQTTWILNSYPLDFFSASMVQYRGRKRSLLCFLSNLVNAANS